MSSLGERNALSERIAEVIDEWQEEHPRVTAVEIIQALDRVKNIVGELILTHADMRGSA